MSVWRVLVDFGLPPPLVLTALLILPTPRVVRKGLLAFAQNVLFLRVVGGLKLVHFVLTVTGMMMIGAAVHTHNLRKAVDETMSANQRTAVMARIWREERNFWICVLTFIMWGMLYRFCSLMLDYMAMRDRLCQLEAQLSQQGDSKRDCGGAGGKAGHAGSGVPPTRQEEPSAPPAPELRQRGKSKPA